MPAFQVILFDANNDERSVVFGPYDRVFVDGTEIHGCTDESGDEESSLVVVATRSPDGLWVDGQDEGWTDAQICAYEEDEEEAEERHWYIAYQGPQGIAHAVYAGVSTAAWIAETGHVVLHQHELDEAEALVLSGQGEPADGG